MEKLLGAVLGLLCTRVCWVKGQVEQSPVALTVQEGDDCFMWCNASTSTNNVQWFYQNPEGRLLSLFFNPSGTKRSGRLTSTTVPKERSSSLNISSSQTTDSGTYFCAMDPQCSADTCSLNTNLQLGSTMAQKITHLDMSRQKGDKVTLNCSYETSQSLYHLYWYKQLPGGEMVFLIHLIKCLLLVSMKAVATILSPSRDPPSTSASSFQPYSWKIQRSTSVPSGNQLTLLEVTVQAEPKLQLLKHSPLWSSAETYT